MRRLRFSLRTLVLLVLLIASVSGLWWRWDAWAPERSFNDQILTSSSDGRFLAMETTDKKHGFIADTASGQTIAELEHFHQSNDKSISYMIYGTRLCWFPEYGPLKMWDIKSGKQIKLGRDYVCNRFDTITVSPDGQHGAYHDWKTKEVCIEDLERGEIRRRLPAGDVAHLGFSPDGAFLCAHLWKDEISLWRLSDGRKCIQLAANNVAFSNDNSLICTTDKFANVRILELESASKIAEFRPWTEGWNGEGGKWYASPHAQFSPDKKWLAVWTAPETVLWNLKTNRLQFRAESSFSAFSSDNLTGIITNYGSSTVQVRRLEDGELLHSFAGAWSFGQLPSENKIMMVANNGVSIWQRRRPEGKYGVLALPELWLTAIFSIALLWSLRREWKESKK